MELVLTTDLEDRFFPGMKDILSILPDIYFKHCFMVKVPGIF